VVNIIVGSAMLQQVQIVHQIMLIKLVLALVLVLVVPRLSQVPFNNIQSKVIMLLEELQVDRMLQMVAHLEVLLAANDVKDVINDKSFDCLIKLKDKYGKYAIACQLQNLIHLNECKR
jgi:hypothetical protein